jgi:hypothetical protein
MNSTHEKLFVRRSTKTSARFSGNVESKYRRSIKTVAQIKESILLAGMTIKSSCDKLLEKDSEGFLHHELKPLLIAMRWLGCFPVYFSKSGKYIHTHTHTYIYIYVYDQMFEITICLKFF